MQVKLPEFTELEISLGKERVLLLCWRSLSYYKLRSYWMIVMGFTGILIEIIIGHKYNKMKLITN